ncbi:MAG: PLP-dependent aminotransferase family protein [Acidobacteriota bacterium]
MKWSLELDRTSRPLYLAIARALASDVSSGKLSPGTRLPTHRELARDLGVTVGTVTRAYAEVERRGLISSEVGRGTFVCWPGTAGSIEDPGVAEGARTIDLAVNSPPPPSGIDLDSELRRVIQELATDASRPDLLSYPPPAGLPRHREVGSMWMARTGLSCSPDTVLATAGAHQAMSVLLTTIVNPGDAIMAEALTYPALKSLARLLHLRLVPVEADCDGPTPEAIAAASRATGARVLYCNPTIHNPTGCVMPQARRDAVARAAAESGLWVVEDDAYGRLDPEAPPPIASLLPERGFYILSLSKTVAPGLRVAFLHVPKGMVERLSEGLRAHCLGVSPLPLEVACRWIAGGTAEQVLQGRREEAQARQRQAREILADWEWRGSASSYHIWLELPEPWRSGSFAAAARARGVSVAPAEVFAVSESAEVRAIRVCLGAPRERASIETALRRIAHLRLASPESSFGPV